MLLPRPGLHPVLLLAVLAASLAALLVAVGPVEAATTGTVSGTSDTPSSVRIDERGVVQQTGTTGRAAEVGDPILGGGDDTTGDDGDDDDGDDGDDGDDTGRDDTNDATRTNDQTAGTQAQDGATSAPTSVASDSTAPVIVPLADTTRPSLASVRPVLGRRSRAHRLRLVATEDVMLEVAIEALGRSRDLIRRRSFRVFARHGASTVRLPNMHLSAKRYRLRIVAVDRTGNRSAVQTVVAGVR